MEKRLNDHLSSQKLSIFGSYNQNSLGDKAILISLLDLLFSECKQPLFIYIISFDKETILDEVSQYEWSKNISIISLSSEKKSSEKHAINISSLKKIFDHLPNIFQDFVKTVWYSKNIIRSNLPSDSSGLIIGGGNLLMDLFPSWPSRVYLLSRIFYTAELPVTFAGVGAFPIKTRIGKFLLRESVRKAALVFVRDQKTKDYLVHNWNISAQSHPDFALSFPLDKVKVSKQNKTRNIAINFAPVYSKWWPYKDEKKYTHFLDGISNCLYEYYVCTNPKPSFWFYETNLSDQAGTEELISHILDLGIPKENINYERKILSSREIVEKLSLMQFAIVTRLHAGLLALRMETPTIAIVYQPKVRDVLNNIGLEKGIVDINDIARIRPLIDEISLDPDEFCLSPGQLLELDYANRDVINAILRTIFTNV
jgi:polysaccharide pyruvyl transferase WcaK-like protein